MEVLAQVAHELESITIERMPAAVAAQGALCILDTVGCMLAGSRTDEAGLLLRCEPTGASTDCTVVGTRQRRDAGGAVRLNGYFGDVLELNDLIGGHASIGNVSAALALGEARGATGTRLLEAVARGIEVTTRIYGAVYPSLKRYTEVGMVPVGLPSAVGAAAAAAHLLQLDGERTAHAMAIAGALSGWCPAEVIFGQGGTMKPLLFGAQPGATGVTAALYASQGMTGPLALMESPTGYFASVAHRAQMPEPGWALLQPRRKLHACCGYLHAAVDGVSRLHKRLGSELQGARLKVRVAPYVADVVSKTHLPASPNDARFHLQYCLALALCGADLILPEHSIDAASQLARPEVRAAMARIEVTADAEISHYHHCVLECAGVQETVLSPRGAPGEPLCDDDVLAKFQLLGQPVIGDSAAQAFARQTMQLEQVNDLHAWMALTVPSS
jgi:2-methylcitrate dehydratase PrpD